MQLEIRAFGSNATEFTVYTNPRQYMHKFRYFFEPPYFILVISIGSGVALWSNASNMAYVWVWSVLAIISFVYVAVFGIIRLMDWNVHKGTS